MIVLGEARALIQLRTQRLLLLTTCHAFFMLPCAQTQNNMDKRSASGTPEPASKQEVLDSLKAKALKMFDQIDLDGNGVIDR